MTSEIKSYPSAAGERSPLGLLSVVEARVLGCLIEKELVTPDIYPMTVNALLNACNQRNNREPLLALSSGEVDLALEGLRDKQLVTHVSGGDSRVAKFRQKFDEVYPMGTIERALLGELLLRGPQTAAGLRGNTERMVDLPPLEEIEIILVELSQRASGALTRKLARQPGQKEARWAQLLTGEPVIEASPDGESSRKEPLTVTVALSLPPEAEKRIVALETAVAELREQLRKLRGALGEG